MVKLIKKIPIPIQHFDIFLIFASNQIIIVSTIMKIFRNEIKRLVALLLCLFALLPAVAERVTIDGLKYYLLSNIHEACLVNENTWSGELDIPTEVSYDGQTYAVTGLSWLAFGNCTELTKVRIPKTIKRVIHQSLSDGAGNGSVSDDCMNPFSGCSALESIEVDEDNSIFKAVDGILFSKDGTRLYCYPGGHKAESYTVPDKVTWIGTAAFKANDYLVTVTLPETIQKICSAFSGCKKLETVYLPKNLTHLEAYMFSECPNLKSIEIPSGIKTISESVFRNCSSLETVVLPENVSSIGDYSFANCTSLETIVIPASLRDISNGLFLGCSNLKSVTIPDGVVRVSLDAFDGCFSLKELDLPASVTDIPGSVFRGCKFNSLIIRGDLGLYPSSHIFDGMDTSSTVYTLASQVKRLQKIYNGVVLPLEDYTSDILPTTYSSDIFFPVVYDLQGRRLSGKPAKGVYIENGRKVVK